MKLAWMIACAAACGGTAPPAPPPPSNQAEPAVRAARPGVQYVGNPDASVVLTYWFDYECPPCVQLSPVLDAISRHYGDRIVVYYKNFPLERHPEARSAAITAEAARKQDRFIDMYHLLIERSPRYAAAELRDYAGVLALDLDQYDADLRDPSTAGAVDREIAEGNQLGLDHVPVLYINGVEYTAGIDLTALSAAIDSRL
jgi:protein-disulfide isomerase